MKNEENFGVLLGQIIQKLDDFSKSFERIETRLSKIDELREELNLESKRIVKIEEKLKTIEAKVNEPKTKWWNVAAGIAAISAVTLTILNILGIL